MNNHQAVTEAIEKGTALVLVREEVYENYVVYIPPPPAEKREVQRAEKQDNYSLLKDTLSTFEAATKQARANGFDDPLTVHLVGIKDGQFTIEHTCTLRRFEVMVRECQEPTRFDRYFDVQRGVYGKADGITARGTRK